MPAGALAVGVTALRLRPRAAWASRRPSTAASVALGLVAGHGLLLAAHVAQVSNLVVFQPMAAVLGLFLLLLAFGFAATATRARAMAPVLAAATVGALAAMDPALLARHWQHRLIVVGFAPYHLALALGAVSAAVLGVAVAALHQASRRSSVTALVGAASAAGLLAGGDLALRLGGVMDHWILAAIALAQGAGLLAVARPRRGAIPAAREFGSAVAASAGIGLLAFALAVTELGHGSLLTLVLAMTAAGAAALAVAWRTPLFASVAGLASVPVILRAASRAVQAATGSPDAGVAPWPILQDTLLPGLVLGGAAVLLARRVGAGAVRDADRRWLGLAGIAAAQGEGPAVSLVLAGTAAGGLLGALVATVRWTAYGNAYAPLSAPSDLGLACALALSGAVAASHLHRATGLRVLDRASRVLAAVAAPFLALAVLLNPFVSGAHLGAWRFLNLLVLAYALPGVLAWRLAREAARPGAPDAATRGLAGGMAVAALLSYATFTVSHLFQGSVLRLWQVSEGELWTHTVVWLAMGVGTLAYGLWARGQVLRLTALGIVAAVAVKVTFVDLAHLTGAARALSVIALGLVLLGIGMAYQRLAKAEAR